MISILETCRNLGHAPALRSELRAALHRLPASRSVCKATAPPSPAARGPAATSARMEQAVVETVTVELAAAAQREAAPVQWHSLGTPAAELRLEHTLPTGQSFRWRQTGPDEFTGVVGQRVVSMRQLENDVVYSVVARGAGADPTGDAAALHDYFNLGQSLALLASSWRAADPRFAFVHPHFPGARVLRQDPLECLLSFICSSNNHISRIHGMVERLCRAYGTPLLEASSLPGSAAAALGKGDVTALQGAAVPTSSTDSMALYAFPTLEQLAAATEEALRADGFGYRAKYITGTVASLAAKPEGGVAWLQALRQVPYAEAAEALCTLPGIGPKVAACVCLFSLDKHDAIPVDTHVWQIAVKYYTPHLKSKSLTKKVHEEVAAAFVQRFGSHAGWAHNTLFISELASMRDKLPAKGAAKAELFVEEAAVEAALQPPTPPEGEVTAGRKRRRTPTL